MALKQILFQLKLNINNKKKNFIKNNKPFFITELSTDKICFIPQISLNILRVKISSNKIPKDQISDLNVAKPEKLILLSVDELKNKRSGDKYQGLPIISSTSLFWPLI